ncbi:MAG TPA: aromatic acid/H+ symport family MFS transporter [Gemmatimonadales bacterium]|jgi:AAHS family 4-hydroxybenzoate transporter-like MFS transporter
MTILASKRTPLIPLIICGLCVVMDGFDVQSMGYVAPAILRDWHIAKASLGPVFGAGLFGMLMGSLALSVVADRIGRRPVLIGATLWFAAGTLLTTQVHTIEQLLLLRFLTGLGLGAIMPNAMALAGEQSPAGRRVTLMMRVSVGFTLGAVFGGLIAAVMIPRWGWASIFYVGGAVPLMIVVAMLRYLPESTAFLERARQNDSPVQALFNDGRARSTTLLWIVNFLNLLNLYFLSNWIPTITSGSGLSTSHAVLAGTTLQIGGTLGTLVMGQLVDRTSFRSVLVPAFAVAAVAIALIGRPALPEVMLFGAIFVAGFGIVGGQPALNALAAEYYPTALRSTGIGWSLGIGRVGSIIGPVLGGVLIHWAWPNSSILLAVALPAAVSAGIVWMISV